MSANPPRSESYRLACLFAAIIFAIIALLTVVAWRSPYLLIRLPAAAPSNAATSGGAVL